MKALMKVRRGTGNIELIEKEEPSITEDQVLIRVKAAGICGSDILIMRDEHHNVPPMVMGHEFSGIIEDVGNGVKGWEINDRVTSQTSISVCGRCKLCRSGESQLCPNKKVIGVHVDGAFAEYIAMPTFGLHKIPENISFEEASITEPAAVVTHALMERVHVCVGDFVVVLGPGPIGIFATQIAKVAGASEVSIIGLRRDERRLKVAKELGVDYAIFSDEEDVLSRIKELTGGELADVVVECSGSVRAAEQSLQIVRNLGKIIAIGIPSKDVTVPWGKLIFKAPEITFHLSSKWTSWEKVISLMSAGRIKTKPMITAFPLEKWQEAFNAIQSGEVVKAVLIP